MAVTVSADGRTVVHRGSEGFSIAFADVCLALGVPIPFINLAFSRDAADTAESVFADGFALMKASSKLDQSYGDEPGMEGGILSGVNRGDAVFISSSDDVTVEGEPLPRALDLMLHNLDSLPNVLSPALIQALQADAGFLVMCYILCKCIDQGNQNCVKKTLAEANNPDKRGGAEAWDPLYPKIWVEPSYDMSVSPPKLILTDIDSKYHETLGGDLMKLPRGDGYPPPRGSRRPDVVMARNKDRQPFSNNIEAIYEFKFPGDPWRTGQLDAYQDIARESKAPVFEVSVDTCPSCRSLENPIRRLPPELVEPFVPPFSPFLVPFLLPELGISSLLFLTILLARGAEVEVEPDPVLGPTEENRREDEQHAPFLYPQYAYAEPELPDPPDPKPDPVPPPKPPAPQPPPPAREIPHVSDYPTPWKHPDGQDPMDGWR